MTTLDRKHPFCPGLPGVPHDQAPASLSHPPTNNFSFFGFPIFYHCFYQLRVFASLKFFFVILGFAIQRCLNFRGLIVQNDAWIIGRTHG